MKLGGWDRHGSRPAELVKNAGAQNRLLFSIYPILGPCPARGGGVSVDSTRCGREGGGWQRLELWTADACHPWAARSRCESLTET